MSEHPQLTSIFTTILEAKARKGVSFERIGKEIGKDEVWVAALLHGQAKATKEQLLTICKFLDVPESTMTSQQVDNWFPHRGIGPIPPTDPTIYRLYEGVLVYGHPIKALIHEKFGDGIMSMVDCKISIDRKQDPKGDRVLLTFDGKFMPYVSW